MMPAKTSFLDRCFYSLGFLDRASPLRVHTRIFLGLVGYHLLALLACIPWLFSWTGVGLAVGGMYVFGMLGINIGFHRLLTHRSFACPRWLERFFTYLGVCCWEYTPMYWASIHRKHHQFSDGKEDPHSPRVNFFWSHMGWFMVINPEIWNISLYEKYARDLLKDDFLKSFERPRVWQLVQFVQWSIFLALGLVIGALMTETWEGAVQMSLSCLIWGVFVRTVITWHVTWSINSLTHIWGYQNFNTRDDSKNNLLIGIISSGEGFHNNHHAQPRSAAHGMRWFELDISYLIIRLLSAVGLAWDVVKPKRQFDKLPDEEKRAAA